MTTYRAEQNGSVVFEDTRTEYEDIHAVVGDWLDNEIQTIETFIYVDDELVSVVTPLN